MKFIKTLLEEKVPSDVYEVVVITMTGDADDYHTFLFEVKTEEDLECFINLLNRLEKEVASAYGDITEFNEYFEDDWHYSEYYDRYGSFDSFEIYYYDKDGKKYEVKVVD